MQSSAAGLGTLGGRPTTSTPASFVWTRAVSGCHGAHDEVSVGNCPREASTSLGVMGELCGGGGGRQRADTERNDTLGSSYSLSFLLTSPVSLEFSSWLHPQLHRAVHGASALKCLHLISYQPVSLCLLLKIGLLFQLLLKALQWDLECLDSCHPLNIHIHAF